MRQRLKEIVDYAADGKMADFATMMGWSPQYVTNLINSNCGFGLTPVVTILERFPEINARWLLIGTGDMITDLSISTREYLYELLNIDRKRMRLNIGKSNKLSAELAASLAKIQAILDDGEG